MAQVLGVRLEPVGVLLDEVVVDLTAESGSLGSRSRSAMSVPRPTAPCGVWGFLNRISPASLSGLMAMILAPFFLATSSALSIRGWLVPGF